MSLIEHPTRFIILDFGYRKHLFSNRDTALLKPPTSFYFYNPRSIIMLYGCIVCEFEWWSS
jgi:hypothetical protein